MRYREYQPCSALAPYIECLWFVSDDHASVQRPSEQVLPDGCIEWIFHLQDRFESRLGPGKWQVQPQSFVVGPLTRFLLLQPSGRIHTMGVRFRPAGAYRFIPSALDALTDEIVPTADIWNGAGTALEDAVLSAPCDDTRRVLLETFLLKQLARIAPRLRFEAAVSEILRSRGQTRVYLLAEKVGCGERQLQREFRESLGLSPKSIGRIVRFQNLLRLAGEDQFHEWASLALDGGYADQAHMVREFQEFTGQSPTARQASSESDLTHHFVSPERLTTLLETSHS